MLFEFYDIFNLVLITKQLKYVSVVEVINIRTHSSKTNKLRNVYTIGRRARNISIRKEEMYLNVLYVNFTVKCLKFAPKWSLSYFQLFWQPIFVTIATIKIESIPDFYTLAIVLIN